MADTAAPTDATPQQEVAAPEQEVPKPEVAAPEVAAPEVPKSEVESPAPEAPKTEAEAPKPAESEPEVAKTEREVPKPEVSSTEAPAPSEEGVKEGSYASLPKPKYNPMHAHTVHHSRSYASTVIADQEMLLANLRNMRRALEKEDRQLSIMSKTLFNAEYPRKWTLPNSYKNEDELRGGYALIHISKRSKLY